MMQTNWEGMDVVCIASGPSLTAADVNLVREWRKARNDRRVIVTNNTYQLAPWADVLYGHDQLWWSKYYALAKRHFSGMCLTRLPRHPIHRSLTSIDFHFGGNSGCGAMGLAQHFGAKRIILLGYDCKTDKDGRRHWHGDHIKGLGNAMSLPKFPAQFRDMARFLQRFELEIVNATRDTVLECWPLQGLEAALAGYPADMQPIPISTARSASAFKQPRKGHQGTKRNTLRKWVVPKEKSPQALATRVCVLRSGGDFGPEHVLQLAEQVPGLVCLTDTLVPGVPCIPLRYDWPGYWAKMELWSGSVMGDLLFFDLDTVIRGSVEEIEHAAQRKTTLLSDFYWPEIAASGVMYIAEADKGPIWNAWRKSPARHMKAKRGRGIIGDQGFLHQHLASPQRWQEVMPGAFVSYKAHCLDGVPPDAKVICFHGQPRPWDPKVQLFEADKARKGA